MWETTRDRGDYRRYARGYSDYAIHHNCDHCGAVTKYREEPREMKCGDPDCTSNKHRPAKGLLVTTKTDRNRYLLIG